MRTQLMGSCLAFACLLVAGSAPAQEIVHALSGTVVKLDSQARTMVVNTNDGSEGQFNLASNPGTSLDFNKDLRDKATPAGSFDKSNTQVVVFYYGNDAVRTAVAVQDLGAGPFVNSQGTVVKVDKHQHVVTIKDASGKSQNIHIDPKAVADTTDGVIPGDKFQPQKGDSLSVVATNTNGVETAVFVHD